jgi:hypothetical protein
MNVIRNGNETSRFITYNASINGVAATKKNRNKLLTNSVIRWPMAF